MAREPLSRVILVLLLINLTSLLLKLTGWGSINVLAGSLGAVASASVIWRFERR